MPATEAQILANRQNAARSTGPKSEEGKANSRANSLKHGLTGAGVVLPTEDLEQVEAMFQGMEAEMRPSGPLGRLLIRRIATLAVRMERSVEQETASLTARVLKAQEEAGPDERERLAAGRRAMFDPSKEACLARKYEAAAERNFYKALKEYRLLGDESKIKIKPGPIEPAPSPQELASFVPAEAPEPVSPPSVVVPPLAPSQPAQTARPMPLASATSPMTAHSSFVPFSVGRSG